MEGVNMPEEPTPTYNQESILDSVKQMVGVPFDYDIFDSNITMFINSTFSTLHQLGVGPETPYRIADRENLWSEFLGNRENIDSVKEYIGAKVRIIFDPPATSFGITALETICKEFEWRLEVASEGGN